MSALPAGETRPRRSGGALFGAKVAAARAIGAASRASGRGGGTTLPGRVLLRLDPEAIARLGGRPRPRHDDRQRHQRQDDDGRDDRRRARRRRARPGPQPGRVEHDLGVATALLEQDGREGLFEVDEAWLPRVAEQLDPS